MSQNREVAEGLLRAYDKQLGDYPSIRRYLLCVSRPVSMGWQGTDFEEKLLTIIYRHFANPEVYTGEDFYALNEHCFEAARMHELESGTMGGRMRFRRIK